MCALLRSMTRKHVIVAASLGCAPLLLTNSAEGFEPNLNSPRARTAAQAAGQPETRAAAEAQAVPVLPRIRVKYRASATTVAAPALNATVARTSDARVQRTVPVTQSIATVVLDRAVSAEELGRIASSIAQSPDVEYAVPEKIERAQQEPDDTLFSDQWDLLDNAAGIHAIPAWANSTGNDVVVAVLDTGIRRHADLSANLIDGYDFVTDSSRSNDTDGRDGDPSDPGDWCPTDPNPMSSWHGTHVAGTIAAVTNNHEGIAGVAPDTKIMPLRVLGQCGGSSFDIADAIRWAAGAPLVGVPQNTRPAQIINLSLGGPGECDSDYADAILEARRRGAIVVVAAGNSDSDSSGFRPANCEGVISVAATNRLGARASFGGFGRGSNFGRLVKLAAPGGETFVSLSNGILSTLNDGVRGPGNDSYEAYQGTSMAAPHVAAVAALIYQAYPTVEPDEVLTILQSTSMPFPSVTTRQCDTSLCGSGIVNGEAAVNEAKQRATVAGSPRPGILEAQRKSINALTAKELMSLRRGVAQMMSWNNSPRDSAEFRRSWVYWANMHAHFGPQCGGPVRGAGMADVQSFTAGNPAETATWCRCEHGTEYFLTWHRMYLWYFERVLQAASRDPSLRLPYWDYASDPTLPAAYRDATYTDEGGNTVPNPLRVDARRTVLNDGTGALSPNVSSASAAMSSPTYDSFSGSIEQTPHGAVHCSLIEGSCPNGLMGAVPSSALDPIFYAHHTNIDRLYDCWLKVDEEGRSPSGQAHLDTEFTFVDSDGSTVKRRVGDMLSLSQLGYSYVTGGGCPTTIALAPAERITLAQAAPNGAGNAANIELVGPTQLLSGVTTVKVNVPSAQRERLASAEATPGGRAVIVVEGLQADVSPGVLYNVYLSDGSGRREPIGVINFFNLTAPSAGTHRAHAESTRSFTFDVTNVLHLLAADATARPNLVFEPTTGLANESDAMASPQANVRFESALLVLDP
ncbi:subtilisin family serine protease [Rhizobium sp. BK077]|uniref:S8 family serine peptidase n=1 Tax=unclassified Rhizobium TaxID=2613769 RepID=UPI00160CE29E|nr:MULTISPECIES: S8 family serine peptidase [unclassified Rhizobium]MBB3303463.1 subtilisin family serine protease [Rhizobium sp. BK112]MBB3372575.1 subtilisin family serine protease [Rhizobium sp. BK077]MBB4183354.1 subtilisin family serine protease [Rhizobium sp. BK109]